MADAKHIPEQKNSSLKDYVVTLAGVFVLSEDDDTTTLLTHSTIEKVLNGRGARIAKDVSRQSTHVVMGDVTRLKTWKNSVVAKTLNKENDARLRRRKDEDDEDDSQPTQKKAKTTTNKEHDGDDDDLVKVVGFEAFLADHPGLKEECEAVKEVVHFIRRIDHNGDRVPISPKKRTQAVIMKHYLAGKRRSVSQ